MSWREAGDDIGWSPIPPVANISRAPTPSSRPSGASGVHIDYGLESNHFTFVPKQRFLQANPIQFALTEEDALLAFQNSKSRDRLRVTAQRKWANFGISRQELARAIGNPIDIVAVDLRNPMQPRVITMQDLETMAELQAEESDLSDTSAVQNGIPSIQRPLSGNPLFDPSNQAFRAVPQASATRAQTVSDFGMTPIVITGATQEQEHQRNRIGSQIVNPAGMGTRQGQARPNLSVRRPPQK